jgi:hypothetical protein
MGSHLSIYRVNMGKSRQIVQSCLKIEYCLYQNLAGSILCEGNRKITTLFFKLMNWKYTEIYLNWISLCIRNRQAFYYIGLIILDFLYHLTNVFTNCSMNIDQLVFTNCSMNIDQLVFKLLEVTLVLARKS